MWLLLAFAVCVSAGVLTILFNAVFGGLDFSSDAVAASKVISLIKKKELDNSSFYDLGSAWGGFDARLARALPGMQVVGLDDDGLRVFFSRFRSWFLKNLEFRKADIFSADLSAAGIIYAYLPQEIMPKLENKLRGLKSGVIVISNKVSFPNWQPAEKIDKIFVYVKE